MKDTKEAVQKYAYSQKAALDFLKQKINKLNPGLSGGSFFENGAKIIFKNLHTKNPQQYALEKFSEISKVVRQISDKNS